MTTAIPLSVLSHGQSHTQTHIHTHHCILMQNAPVHPMEVQRFHQFNINSGVSKIKAFGKKHNSSV